MREKMWIKNLKKRKKYYQISSNREPAPLLLHSFELGDFQTALDLGCGAGVDAKEMSRRGIQVTAVDINPEVRNFFQDTPEIKCVITPFQEFDFENYDLIYSRVALVFIPREDFEKVVNKIKAAINPSGVVALRVWGENDSANQPRFRERRTFTTIEEMQEVFRDFEIIELNEIEKDGTTNLGKPKHWHVIDLIARKE